MISYLLTTTYDVTERLGLGRFAKPLAVQFLTGGFPVKWAGNAGQPNGCQSVGR
jgi:hypothetical protein